MGAKSDMNSAKLALADDDGDESRETISLVVLVRRSLVKCLVALILFFFLLIGAAWTVHVYERPLEEVAQAADAAERARYAEMIQRLFKLYDVPADRGLSGDSCVAAYANYRIPAYVDGGVTFPEQAGIYPVDTGVSEVWLQASDNYTACATSGGSGCVLRCLLKAPTATQVEACRATVVDERNPAAFDAQCLASSPSCPNCNILRTRVDDLVFQGPAGTDAEGRRKLQLAEVYAMYRAKLESDVPQTNWDFKGSLFFAFTVLTAVGYGNYAPVTYESKLCITVLTIPGIAVFGYALAQFADISLSTLLWVKVKLGVARGTPVVHNRARRWADTLRECDSNGDGTLSLEEIVAGADKICMLIGIDVAEKSVGKERLGRGAHRDAARFVEAAFLDADIDGNGRLSMLEAMAMVSDLVRVREMQLSVARSWDQLAVATVGLLPLLIAAGFGFLAFERAEGNDELTILDAFYFVIVSLTTVGLGDITPTHGPSVTFWYFYMTAGLGLIAIILAQTGNILSTATQRMELKAFRPSKSGMVQGKKGGKMNAVAPAKGDVEGGFKKSNK